VLFHANSLVRKSNIRVRSARPREQDAWRYAVREQRVTMDPRPSRERVLTFVYFRSFGCRFDRAGECTMCNYAAAERVDAESIVASVREALAQRDHYDALGISPFGNMFDDTEVPAQARDEIFAMAAGTDAAIMSCESRPETLSDELIGRTVRVLGGKRLFINLGLEAAHPWVQAHCVGKSLSNDSFCSATAALRRHGAFPVSNVLLGAPFLTEEEAVQSAVGTIRWALSHGSHLCVLFPSNVKGWTLQEWLWERDMFRVPSLWSLVEALRRLGPDLARSVALSWYSATPTDPHRLGQVSDPLREAPTTCPACRADVISGLDRFNAGAGMGVLDELCRLGCPCRDEWASRLASETATAAPLIDRVVAAYDRIGSELVGEDWWRRNRERVRAELSAGYSGAVSPVDPGSVSPAGPGGAAG
jgi:archaeosine synthase beta-subunit